jgi:hypothetical protein
MQSSLVERRPPVGGRFARRLAASTIPKKFLLVSSRVLHTTQQVRIPTSHYIVFYGFEDPGKIQGFSEYPESK